VGCRHREADLQVSRRRAGRIAGRCLAAGAVLVFAGRFIPIASAAATDASFDGASSAYGLRINESVPNGPVADTVLDAGGPTAQATLSSLGNGAGYAALPDPGTFVLSIPGLLAGLAQFNQDLPDYPLAVSASSTTPQQDVSTDGYAIKATLGNDSATGSAGAGLGRDATLARGPLVTSDASVKRQVDGSVTSTATSVVEGLTLGPVTIGRITSTATRTLSAAGVLSTSSNLSVTNVRVDGTPVQAPQPQQGSGSSPFSFGPAVDPVLKPLGISFQTLAAQKLGDTIVAPALVLTGSFPVDPAHKDAGTGTYHLILGQATARLVGSAAPTFGTGGPAGTATTTPPASGSVPAGTTLIATGPSAGGVTAGSVSGQQAGLPTVAFIPGAPTRATDAQIQAALTAMKDSFDVGGLYVILVIAGVVTFVVAQLVRMRGVRAAWTSSGG
jgi:hypothetical protein